MLRQKVFISYSSADEELVKNLAKMLAEMSIDYSLDRKDINGESYNITGESRKGLSECSAVVAVISPSSLKSTWLPFEIGQAMGAGKKLLPLLTQPSLTIPGYLKGYQYWNDLDDAKEYFKHMLDAPQISNEIKPAADKSGIDEPHPETLGDDKKSIPAKAPIYRKSTGIKSLDLVLDGGIACGSVVTITADPRTTAEVWLYQITQVDRTFYFTTEKSPRDIKEDISLANFNFENVFFIDIYSHYINGISNNDILNLTENYLEKISDEAQTRPIIIFDNFSFYLNLDIDPKSLKSFMNYVSKKIKKIEAVLYLYTLKQNNKLEDMVYSSSDTIFDIGLKKHSESIMNYLSVLKNKKGTLPKELIRLKIEDGAIQIDTTRDVA